MKELLNTGVNLTLEYDESTDALIGQVKGYSVAVKENLETGSYGCLFWIREGDFTAITTAEEYLTDYQKANPEYIKKFRVTEQGAAVALNRTNDDFTNVNNLKRFIFDFTTSLSLNFYKNCCCECGKTDDLAIYSADGVIAQACSACGAKYQLLRDFDKKDEKPAVQEVLKAEAPVTAAPVREVYETVSAAAEKPMAEETVLTEIKAPVEEGLSELMFTGDTEDSVQESAIPEQADAAEEFEAFDQFLISDAEEKQPERPRSKLFEEAEREFAEEQARLAAEAAKNPVEDSINDLLIDESGEIALKEVKPEMDDGSSDVTEIHDDSNDGEEVEIEEIESTVMQPTVTTGHPQLSAEETPLEEDGSVPLINPNSHREERHVSPVDGPDAVQPLEFVHPVVNEELNADSKRELPPGYASGDNMERDVKTFSAPPPYTPSNRYASIKTIRYAESSNAFMGIIGTLVLGAVGVAVWCLIAGLLNLISYWGSIAIVISVFGGYYLAGKAMDKKGIVISFIMSLILMLAGLVVVSSVEVQQAIKNVYYTEATFMESIEWFIYSLSDPDAKETFMTNLVTSSLITLVADIVMAVNMWKKT